MGGEALKAPSANFWCSSPQHVPQFVQLVAEESSWAIDQNMWQRCPK